MAVVSPTCSPSIIHSPNPSPSNSSVGLCFSSATPASLTFSKSNSDNFLPQRKLVVSATASDNHSNISTTAFSSNSSAPSMAISKVRRHTISVFVGDESGMINRIAGVFARRGYNIEFLAVGLNKDKALFTIVISGTERYLSNEPQVERELMLVKVNADPNYRTEIMWLEDIFRAKFVDISEHSLTIEVTGDPGKMVAALKNLSKYGIREIARTGKGDVYPVEPSDSFTVTQVLDAHWDNWTSISHSINVINDSLGVLNIVTGVFARRGYNIQTCSSLAVGHAKIEGLSQITTVVPGTDESISKLMQLLYKLVDIHEDLTHLPFAERELMLIKVAVNAAARQYVLDIASIFRGKAIDVSDHTITLELTGDLDKMVALQRLLEPYGICEVARSGRIALVRESGVVSKYLRGYSFPI
ncbi:hypothetical protein P3X46_002708 [Hevea brasiliensis]|uniref:ACT domain-containing protein n=1 Tax=Hevea brasiliensis TaxID=3981 RepID=A0ABQ9N7A7_HEVBR|nr:hypothetical protein P3X46_002708 [Hevea brasiliensis]